MLNIVFKICGMVITRKGYNTRMFCYHLKIVFYGIWSKRYMYLPYRSDNLMLSFWANALQSDVLPVPGGP